MNHTAEDIAAAYGSFDAARARYGSLRKAAAEIGTGETWFRQNWHREQAVKTGSVHKSRIADGSGHKQPVNPAAAATYDQNCSPFANREPSFEELGEALDMAFTKATRETVLFLYDVHLPNESEANIALALDYAQSHHRISRVVLGGDLLDCAGISRFKKNPHSTMPLHEELEYAVNWLEGLRERFGGIPIDLIKGNHEDRLQSYLWTQAAEISKLKGLTLQEQLELDRLDIQWVDNLKRVQDGLGVYQIGKLNVLHGHEMGICPSINPARQFFLRGLDNLICGHVHKVDEHFANTIGGKVLGSWVCGPLCDMHPDYRPINPWVAGFALAHFDMDGLFSVELRKIIEGRVL